MVDKLQKKRGVEGTSKAGSQDDIVYAHIFDAILEQRLAPGTKLSEETLGEIFGVSRTIIRRALSRLTYEQVVQLRPNRGAVVASPSVDEARQVFAARRIIERAVIELATEHATDAEIAIITGMVKEEQACFKRGDKGAGIRLSGEFHMRLALMAKNGPLHAFQKNLVSQTSLIIAQYDNKSKSSFCSYEEHFALINAIAAGDKTLSVELMMTHLDHIENKLDLDEAGASGDLQHVFSHFIGLKAKD